MRFLNVITALCLSLASAEKVLRKRNAMEFGRFKLLIDDVEKEDFFSEKLSNFLDPMPFLMESSMSMPTGVPPSSPPVGMSAPPTYSPAPSSSTSPSSIPIVTSEPSPSVPTPSTRAPSVSSYVPVSDTFEPTVFGTPEPTPSTLSPTDGSTSNPDSNVVVPTIAPTVAPTTMAPTLGPSSLPTFAPTTSLAPSTSQKPSANPSASAAPSDSLHPSLSPTFFPSLSLHPTTILVRESVVFSCAPDGLQVAEPPFDVATVVNFRVGYSADSLAPLTEYQAELERLILMAAVVGALQCIGDGGIVAPAVPFETTLIPGQCPSEPTNGVCIMLLSEFQIVVNESVEPDIASFLGYINIQEEMSSGAMAAQIDVVDRVEYISPLPLLPPITSPDDSLIPDDVQLDGSDNPSISAWTVGAVLAMSIGGLVALWAWFRNRRTRNEQHMQLLEDSALADGAA